MKRISPTPIGLIMPRFIHASIFSVALAVLCFGHGLSGQEKNQEEGVTVRGQIVAPEKFKDVDLNQLKIKLEQQVQLPALPFPANWNEMQLEARQKWLADFQASEKGKKFFADRQKKFDSRKQFEIEIEDEGKFVLFDVPPANYGIVGQLEKSVDGKLYVLEVYGQVEVAKVDELQLAKLQVMATRILQVGEPVPQFNLPSLDGSKKFRPGSFNGKYVLVHFWSAQSPPSASDIQQLAKFYKSLKAVSANIEFLGVCLDEKVEAAEKFVKENKIDWPMVAAKGWSSDTVEAFGVRSIPYYCLFDGKAKIRMNNLLFYQLFQTGEVDFEKIMKEALTGKDMKKVLADLQKQAEEKNKK